MFVCLSDSEHNVAASLWRPSSVGLEFRLFELETHSDNKIIYKALGLDFRLFEVETH